MKVRILAPGQTHEGVVPGLGVPTTPEADASSYGGWEPRCVLGAESPGGLALPPAHPTAATMYAPRGAWTDGQRLIAADTGNHRVLIWHRLPTTDGQPADVVLGQPDATSEGPAAGGRGAAGGLHLPTGILVHDDRLLIADAWHHRVLMWDAVPEATDTPPDAVWGQSDLTSVEPNAGGEPTAASCYWPFGIAVIGGRFYLADTGNRRVLGWREGIPEPGQPADVVLGQPTPWDREENRGGEASAASFRWPHDLAAAGAGILVADAGNHRLLRWDTHPDTDRPADGVLGQPDFTTSTEFPYVSQEGRVRFPYAVTSAGDELAVADTANNRVLVYSSTRVEGQLRPDAVLAQPTYAANGENRWQAVAADTLCWPYGLHWHETRGEPGLLAVADSGNNRVVLWERRGGRP